MTKLLRIIAAETGLSLNDILKIMHTAPRRYKVFSIPKRSGGMREIAQPARELKAIQRAIVKHILNELPVHDAACAYRKGVSIRDNALVHAGDSPILKMDFANFFPSIRSVDWEEYCVRTGILSQEDIYLSIQFLFRQAKKERILKLSIGAPSSPTLSNILLFPLDEFIFSEAKKRSINYTRYADDLTFSRQRAGMLKDMIDVVRAAIVAHKSPALKINESKTVLITAGRRRIVTGIVLANNGTLSLGRDKKRLLSAQVHYALMGKLSAEAMGELCGQLAFVNVVEPDFLTRLQTKYGEAIIKQIRSSVMLPTD